MKMLPFWSMRTTLVGVLPLEVPTRLAKISQADSTISLFPLQFSPLLLQLLIPNKILHPKLPVSYRFWRTQSVTQSQSLSAIGPGVFSLQMTDGST